MIYLGPAGYIADGLLESLEEVEKNGLNAQELEFVYNVNVKEDAAKLASESAKKKNIILSAHGSYYINLNSEDKSKIEASKKRIMDACKIADVFSSTRPAHIVFHAGFYGKVSREDTYKTIKKEMTELQEKIQKNKLRCVLAPETTGKESQFGNIDELVRLSNETGCRICIDFAHIYARNIGKLDLEYVFRKIHELKFLKDDPFIHCHFTGIEFGPKGEKNHINLTEEFFMPLARKLKEESDDRKKNKIDFCIISESPITYKDSLLMRRILEKI